MSGFFWRHFRYLLALEVSPLLPASTFFSATAFYCERYVSVSLLFYRLLLFSQVKYINYSSIFCFQSLSLHILPSKVHISQQGFKTRCSPRGDNMRCTHCKTIVYSPSSRLSAKSKAYREGIPLQKKHLRSQMLSKRHWWSLCLWTVITVLLLHVQGTREASVFVSVVNAHLSFTRWMHLLMWQCNWEKWTWRDLQPALCTEQRLPKLQEAKQICYAAQSSGTLWNSLNISLRTKFKLCMRNSVQSSVNSYALNGLDDWQLPGQCCHVFLWVVQVNIKRSFLFGGFRLVGAELCTVRNIIQQRSKASCKLYKLNPWQSTKRRSVVGGYVKCKNLTLKYFSYYYAPFPCQAF